MAQQVQGLGVLAGDQAKGDLAVGGQRLVGPHQTAVHFGGQGGLGQTRADVGGNVDRSNVTRVFEGLSVGQGDFEHRSPASLRAANQNAAISPAETTGGRRLGWELHSDRAPKNNPPTSGAFNTKDAPRIRAGGTSRKNV